MKLPRVSFLSVPFLLPAMLLAGKTRDVPLTLHVDSFHLVHIGRDRAEAEIDLSVTTGMDARIERIDFSGIHANGVPFFAQPLAAPIDLHRDQPLSLPPIAVTVYTGDLDSIDPLMAILDQRQTHLQAELAVRVQATPLEHLLLRDGHPLAVFTVDQDVDVQPPGGLLGRASAMALLKAAQIALGGASHLPVRLSSGNPVWQQQIEIAQTALLHARSCYTPTKKNANEVCIDRLAFALGPQDAVSGSELGSPWRFDPRLAKSFADQGGRVQTGDPRVTVQPLGTDSSAMAATVEPTGTPAEVKVVLLPSRSRLTVLDPNSPGLYSRLRMAGDGTASAFRIPPEQLDGERLAVFRLARNPDGDWLPRAVYLSGTLTGRTIAFSRPVDRSAVGSPILTPQGVIGVVQSETAGTLLSPAY